AGCTKSVTSGPHGVLVTEKSAFHLSFPFLPVFATAKSGTLQSLLPTRQEREQGTSLILTLRGPSANLPECHEPLGRSKQGWSITSSIVATVSCDCFTTRPTTTPASECWSRDSSVIRWIF